MQEQMKTPPHPPNQKEMNEHVRKNRETGQRSEIKAVKKTLVVFTTMEDCPTQPTPQIIIL